MLQSNEHTIKYFGLACNAIKRLVAAVVRGAHFVTESNFMIHLPHCTHPNVWYVKMNWLIPNGFSKYVCVCVCTQNDTSSYFHY